MKLLALNCPQCRQPLAANNDDVVLLCAGCHTAVRLDDSGVSRAKLFFAAGRDDEQHWLPFWVFSGSVRLVERKTQGGGRSGQEEAEAMWAAPRRLYVPAWELSLQAAQNLGANLIQQQPDFRFVTPPAEATLASATVAPADAQKLLEFIVLAIEARRQDWLKELNFHLDVNEPELWALPQSVVKE